MKKPQMKKEVEITHVFNFDNEVWFHATQDAVADFRSFGSVTERKGRPDWYSIDVDARFDFDEVVNYIRSYGRENEH